MTGNRGDPEEDQSWYVAWKFSNGKTFVNLALYNFFGVGHNLTIYSVSHSGICGSLVKMHGEWTYNQLMTIQKEQVYQVGIL